MVDASIVIPTFNRLDHLKSTLESLNAMDFPRGLFEVVVVNDGSEDGTGSFLSKTQFDLQVRVIQHKSNRGRAVARNSGVREARGRIMIFLDDDMEVVPGFLKAHLCKQGEGAKRVVLGNVSSSPKIIQTALIRYLDTRGVHKLKPGQSVPFRYFSTGNVSVKRDLLIDAGLFDERFHEWGGEDLELGYRLSKAGAEFAYASEARSYQTDYRKIPEFYEIIETYGECSLPIIIEKHPELKPLFKIHLLEPVAIVSEPFFLSVKKVLFRLALWNPWRAIIASLVSVFNRLFVPAILFDYLILSYCLRGFKKFWLK